MGRIYFEDLNEGQPLACRPVLLTKTEIIAFARQFDPQPFHLDEQAAKASIFKGLVASSLHTLAACTRVVVQAQKDVAIISGIGMHAVKMTHPVRPGDRLAVQAWWCELERSTRKPDRGLASIRCRVTNQNQEEVVAYGYRYLIAARPGD